MAIQMDPTEKFNINLNQNLWLLLIAFVSIGLSEYYCLKSLYIFSLIPVLYKINNNSDL